MEIIEVTAYGNVADDEMPISIKVSDDFIEIENDYTGVLILKERIPRLIEVLSSIT
jgi:hypothetical protein